MSADLIAVGGLAIILGLPALGVIVGSLTAALVAALALTFVAIAYLLRRVRGLSRTNVFLQAMQLVSVRRALIDPTG